MNVLIFITATLLLLSFNVNAGPSSKTYNSFKTYNCKRDTIVDDPMDFTIKIVTPYHIRLSAFGGSDESPQLVQRFWTIKEEGGRSQIHPSIDPEYRIPPDVLDSNAIVPGRNYEISLISMDLCGNLGTRVKKFTMPNVSVIDNSPPVVEKLISGKRIGEFSRVGFLIYLYATDNMAIKQVHFYVGTSQLDLSYASSTHDFLNDDINMFKNGLLNPYSSSLDDGRYAFFLDENKYPPGACYVVRAILEDVVGNQSRTEASVCL